MEEYEKLLNEAYKEVKPVEHGERFTIPEVTGHIEGKKTIITNFSQIASVLRRNKEQFLKFLLRELATSGVVEGDRLILDTKIPSSRINEKIKQYAEDFVICKECGKPDTELTKQDRFLFLHCMACGAKHSVKSKI
ncbi:translation initiation factor IF-2 subunit beta [Candidatus Woesearchaeota archaeon CG10_big_fil_rev_8_21_14_0_10_34_12]|nr:MAG: translation initiation factor IF-2 subunit beta [Candidatus Woesearchaeota archaeon CG10_big_fil_rev_8_21_14_0_10_34_12]